MWKIAVSTRSHQSRFFSPHKGSRSFDFLSYARKYACTSDQTEIEWLYDPDTGIVSRRSSSEEESLFQTVIGMEIHAQLAIPTKLFSSAPTSHYDHNNNSNEESSSNITHSVMPNSAVWPLDVAVPGVLPRVSIEAVQAAILTAAACQCHIPHESRFERKHYAYADQPLGYQVTQQRWPLATNGTLTCRRIPKMAAMPRENEKQNKTRRPGQAIKSKNEHQHQQQLSEEDKFFSVGIDRIQLEQDTGKTTTVTRRTLGKDGNEYSVTESLVDFNRAGCALVEIVFNPDLRSGKDAASVLSTLRDLLRHIGTCDGKMEKGSLRCDLNVSIAPIGADQSSEFVDKDNPFQALLPPGTGHRVEVKNLNSLKQVMASAEYEAIRQAKAYMDRSPTARETRTFDVSRNQTVTIRSKEGAVDYRFMPDPDLPPVVLNEEALNGKTLEAFLADSLPELPEAATSRLMEEYSIAEDIALVITGDASAIHMYEVGVETALINIRNLKNDSHGVDRLCKKVPSMVANWLCNDCFGLVRESATKQVSVSSDKVDGPTSLNHPISVKFSPVNGEQLGLLIALISEDAVSTTMGKKILSAMFHESKGMNPREIADARGWKVISDTAALRLICMQVILHPKNKSQLDKYKKGGRYIHKMEKFFTGKAMRESKGNAHPERLKEQIAAVLEELALDGELTE